MSIFTRPSESLRMRSAKGCSIITCAGDFGPSRWCSFSVNSGLAAHARRNTNGDAMAAVAAPARNFLRSIIGILPNEAPGRAVSVGRLPGAFWRLRPPDLSLFYRRTRATPDDVRNEEVRISNGCSVFDQFLQRFNGCQRQ
jgi:hypothetical protein